MKTEILDAGLPEALERAGALLSLGEVIALPTDTVYGVAADGFDAEAIEKLYRAKERPRDKAIPLLLASADELNIVVAEMPSGARVLASRFWPGALTLVVPASAAVPSILLAGGDSIAVRVPAHRVPRELARRLGRPLAATSANISGGPDPATAAEVLAQLGGRVPLVLDGGQAAAGVPSTVVDFSRGAPRVVRAGAIPVAELERVLGSTVGA